MTAVISVSTNGSSVSASSSGGPLTSTITSFILGMNSLGAHIEFFGLYRADQVPDLVSASTASPPIPTGPNNLYADFVEGIYYLNGVVSSLGAIFTPTPYDGGAGNVNPANIIVDGEGLLIENYTSMPMDTGSSAELTTAGLDAAQALADLGAMAGILKYTIDSGSIGFGAYVFQMNASVGSLLIEDLGFASANKATVVANSGDFALPQPSTSDPETPTQMAWIMLFESSSPPVLTEGQTIRAGCNLINITSVTGSLTAVGTIIGTIDNGIPYDPTGATEPIAPGDWDVVTPTSTITGLTYLENKIVDVLADGGWIQGLTVSNSGTVTLPSPANFWTVGLAYEATFISLKLDTGEPTTQGKRKTLSAATIRVNCTIGPDFGHVYGYDSEGPLYEVSSPWTSLQIPYTPPGATVSDDVRPLLQSDWTTYGQVVVQQKAPMPVSILAIMPEFTIGDTGR